MYIYTYFICFHSVHKKALLKMHILLPVVLLVGLIIIQASAELVAVVQIFRHGHRTPVEKFITDPYHNPSNWDGLEDGQLTNIGKRDHFTLGQYTRKRYKDFLPTKYDSRFIYVQTTDVDRTHMSAQTNLYGMFPASGTQQWRKNIDWQAIPIHPADSSVFDGSYFGKKCDAYVTLLTQSLNGEDYADLNEQYSDLFKFLSEKSGEVINDYTDINSVWDPLKAEDYAGYKLPSWTESVYPEPLRTLSGKIFESYSHTPKLRRYRSGLFINEIVEYLESMSANSSSTPKFKIYSGHDTNIAATLSVLGAYDPPYPPAYASSIYFELHKENWQYLVKVFSKDGDTIKQISVNGCNINCPLSEFREHLSDFILDDETREFECSQPVTGGKSLIIGPYSEDQVRNKWAGKYN